ncbi:MAG: YebC/PmpR family DNA-binding transcriptional regulator [Clostridia bacterium]|nr:YebC/PmpR family DNA-binding transcriptional regulator [Clostridia bacterium]
MSGHSKWHNIQAKKSKTDAARAKIFTKIGKEMMIAIREGGANPESNSKLRDLITKAKANNVPNDNIERIIKRASGNDAVAYEELVYEGYGPSGVAVIVEAATDSKNRTAGDVRHGFDKFGGNLGQTGCVGFLFSAKGVIEISETDEYGDKVVDSDKLMEDALEAGASDFVEDDGIYTIYTEPDDLSAVTEALSAKGYTFESAESAKVPSTYVSLDNPEDVEKMTKLLDYLEEDDDIVNVWHNWDGNE